jgi:hypothetical protein
VGTHLDAVSQPQAALDLANVISKYQRVCLLLIGCVEFDIFFYFQQFPNVRGFFAVSSLNGKGLHELRQVIFDCSISDLLMIYIVCFCRL